MERKTTKKLLKTSIILLSITLVFTMSVNIHGTPVGAIENNSEREAVGYQIDPETTSYNMGGKLDFGDNLETGENNIHSEIDQYRYPMTPTTLSGTSQKVSLLIEATDLIHIENPEYKIPANNIKVANNPLGKANTVIRLDSQKTKRINWMKNISPPSEEEIKDKLKFYISTPSGGVLAGDYNGTITIRYKSA